MTQGSSVSVFQKSGVLSTGGAFADTGGVAAEGRMRSSPGLGVGCRIFTVKARDKQDLGQAL